MLPLLYHVGSHFLEREGRQGAALGELVEHRQRDVELSDRPKGPRQLADLAVGFFRLARLHIASEDWHGLPQATRGHAGLVDADPVPTYRRRQDGA